MFLRQLVQLALLQSFLVHGNIAEASLKEFIKFKQVSYESLPSEFYNTLMKKLFQLNCQIPFQVSGNFPFDPYNNIPQGFAPYINGNGSSKVFIAVPRRYLGVPSTLNYVEIEDGQELHVDPKLRSYPNYEMNELDVSEGGRFVK